MCVCVDICTIYFQIHVFSHSSICSKLFSFPPQPPYWNTTHLCISGSKRYLSITARHLPPSSGKVQISFGVVDLVEESRADVISPILSLFESTGIGLHLDSHFNFDAKLLSFPSHPPQMNSSQMLEASL